MVDEECDKRYYAELSKRRLDGGPKYSRFENTDAEMSCSRELLFTIERHP